jgi:hypothetical protein
MRLNSWMRFCAGQSVRVYGSDIAPREFCHSSAGKSGPGRYVPFVPAPILRPRPSYKTDAPTVPAVIAWLHEALLNELLERGFNALAFRTCGVFPNQIGITVGVGYRKNCVCDSDVGLPRLGPQLKWYRSVEIVFHCAGLNEST